MLKLLNRLLFASIIIFVIGDILRKVAIYHNLEFIRYTAISKSIVLVLYIIVLIVFFKSYYSYKTTRKIIYSIIILCAVYFLGQLCLNDNDLGLNLFNKNNLIFSRYIYWPFTILVFYPLLTSTKFVNKQFKLYEYFFLFNAVLIILSLIFSFTLFKTYFNPQRFGYMGVFNTHNQASYAFILFILYYYYNGIFKKENTLKLLFVILVSLLIGTKKIYLFLILLCLYHFVKFKLWNKRNTYIQAASLLILGIIFLPIIKNKFQLFIDIYNERGIITSLFSYRDDLLISTMNNTVKSDWSALNYFLGGPKFYESRTEFGILDLYLFFGIMGLLIYYKLFKLFYNLTDNNKFYLFGLIVIGFVAMLAEGFFSSANQPLIFVLISATFISYSKKNIDEDAQP